MEHSYLRKFIFRMVEKTKSENRLEAFYDTFISAVAIISLTPLMFKHENSILRFVDILTVYILFADYIFRWMTNDYRHPERKRVSAFITYPVSFFAIIDILSIMPSLGLLGQSLKVLRLMRIFKLAHYSNSFNYVISAFKKESYTLVSVLIIALGYIFISALIMFSYEPDTFRDFFQALYWATTALTTVGYGDIYPVTDVGMLISMISSIFGIAIIALPAGIITASFVQEIDAEKEKKRKKKKGTHSEKHNIDSEREEIKSVIRQIIERRMAEDNIDAKNANIDETIEEILKARYDKEQEKLREKNEAGINRED